MTVAVYQEIHPRHVFTKIVDSETGEVLEAYADKFTPKPRGAVAAAELLRVAVRICKRRDWDVTVWQRWCY